MIQSIHPDLWCAIQKSHALGVRCRGLLILQTLGILKEVRQLLHAS